MRWREKSRITLIYSNKSCMKPEGRAVMERKRRVLSPSAGLIRRSLISGLPAVLPYLLSMLILFTGITFQFVLTYDSKFAPYLQQILRPLCGRYTAMFFLNRMVCCPCKFVCFWRRSSWEFVSSVLWRASVLSMYITAWGSPDSRCFGAVIWQASFCCCLPL